MLAHLLDGLRTDLLHSIEELQVGLQCLFLSILAGMSLCEGLHFNWLFFLRSPVFDAPFLCLVPGDNEFQFFDDDGVLLPDEVQCELSLDVVKVLAQLLRQVRIKHLERVECEP